MTLNGLYSHCSYAALRGPPHPEHAGERNVWLEHSRQREQGRERVRRQKWARNRPKRLEIGAEAEEIYPLTP